MKTIEPVSIWDNGVSRQAVVLNAYAVNVSLNNSATFWYELYDNPSGSSITLLTKGNVYMTGEAYQLWDQDEFAWEFIAHSLNLVITGEYVNTVPATSIVEETTTTTTTIVVE